MRDGTNYTISSGTVAQIEDHNGNYTSFGGTVTDSVGRTYQAGSGSNTETITYKGYAAAPRTVTVHYAPLGSVLASGNSLETYGQLWTVSTPLQNAGQQFNPNSMVSEIDMPDGSKYTFLYDSYGDVAQMTLPTGGVIQYSYGNAANYATTERGSVDLIVAGQPVATEVPPAYMYALARPLLERREYLNGAYIGKIHFPSTSEMDSYNAAGNLLAKQVQTIASSGTLPSAGLNYNPSQYNQKTTVNYYDANGSTVLESQSISYYQPSNCLVNCPTVQTVTTTMNGEVKQTSYTYDQYNDISGQQDRDWGSNGSPGAVIRNTQTTYNTASNYIGANILGLATEVKVLDGSNNVYTDTKYSYDTGTISNDPNIPGAWHDNTNFGTGNTTRGNLTSIQQCLNISSCTWLATTMAYDMAGNLLSVTDANSHTTSFGYSDNYADGVNRNSYGYVTAVTNALGQYSFQADYDYNLGQPVLTADIMGQYTTHYYGTSGFGIDRLAQVNYANGGHTYYSFLSPMQILTRQDQNTSGDEALQWEVKYDDFGRVLETDTFEGPTQYIASLQSYDVLGRLVSATNPSRYSLTSGNLDGLGYVTTYSYDGLSRQTAVTTPDGSVSTTSYSMPYTTITDPAGHARVLDYDALGRLTAVWEDPNGLDYETTYTWGANNTLQGVQQGPQSSLETRSFGYDSLGRMLWSAQPESGTITYTYDHAGNLSSQTDARGVTSSYTYDKLNRVLTIGYNDNKTYTRTFGYDAPGVANSTGHLTSVWNYTALSFGPFSAVGQVLASSETTDYATYNFSYNYNLAGALTQETYPSGRVITTGYDSANRVNAVSGTYNGAGTTYVASVSYWPHGAPNNTIYGNTLNVVAGYFNKELQVTGMWHVIAGNPNEFLWLEYPNWGTTNNNGTLEGNAEFAGGPAPWTTLPYYSRSYGYDGLNRLSSASETETVNNTTTNTWSRTFNYDPFGNAWVPKVSGVPYGVSTPEWDVYNTKNQVSSSPYDAAGDIAALPGGYSFLYDGEHRVTSETGSGQNYYYDGLGQRVTKVVGSTTTVYVNDAFGNLAAEYAPSNTWSKDYVYFGGQMVTVENAVANPCKTCYLSYDYLGTPRLVTDANANVVARHDYLPFGDEIPEGEAGRGAQYGPYTDNVNQKFTGQYRDMETLNDFFGARYYTAPLMRFLTPDPASLAAVDMSDPQTWNQYAYVRNNPLALVDPSGMDPANTAPIPVACPGCTVTVTDNDLESVCWWCWEYGIPWTYVPSQPSSQSGQSGQSGPPTNAQQPPPKKGTCPAGATAAGLTYPPGVQQHIEQRHMYYLSNGAGASTTIPFYNRNGTNVPASQYMFEPDSTPKANWQLVLQINAKTFSLATPVPSRSNVTFTAPLGPQGIPFPLARPFIGIEYGGWLNIFGLKFPFPALPTDVNTLVTKPDCQTVVTSHPGNP